MDVRTLAQTHIAFAWSFWPPGSGRGRGLAGFGEGRSRRGGPGAHRRPTRRRRVGLAGALVVGLVLVAGGWTGVRATQARDHLLTAATLMRQLQTQISAADVAAAQTTLAALQVETRAAKRQTTDPVWRAGRHLPWIGANLGAVATIADVLDELVHNGLPPLVDIAGRVSPTALAPRDGHIDLTVLDQAAPQIRAADSAVRRARDRIAAISGTHLVPSVAGALADLRTALDHAASVTATAVLAGTLLPPMLGGRGPRTYLVLFQNLAEPRATGGELGAFAVVRAEGGRITIVGQGTASYDLKSFDTPVLPLDPGMAQLYTDRLGKYPADVNATPHFPTAAALARQMYQLRTGTTVDAVLATDPVALSYLLAATGSVSVPGGPALTKDNVVRELLSDVYFRIGGQTDQDRYFADASRTLFDTLAGGRGDAHAAVAGLVRAAAERRILVWSADPAEQALLAGTVLGGVLPDQDGVRPTVGIFLNDGTGAKLGYYLTHDSEVAVGGCRADGRRELRVTVRLGSTAPATGLPSMLSGFGDVVPPYTLRTNLMIFSPTAGAVVSATRDGAPLPVGSGEERGRAVAVAGIDLRPGEQTTVAVTVLTGVLPGQLAFTPDVWTTPGITPWPRTIESAPACPAA